MLTRVSDCVDLDRSSFPKGLDIWLCVQTQGTHVHNEEIEPAPGIGEIHLEAVGHPFQQHLQDEDVGEDLVSIFQDGADDSPLFNVDVFEGLKTSV